MGAKSHIKRAVKAKRKRRGEVAQAVGMPEQVYANLVSRDKMSFSTAEEIAAALGCQVVFLDNETGQCY